MHDTTTRLHLARGPLAAVAAVAVLLGAPARAHEVVHDVERGRAVAVHVRESDGEPLADMAYEVWSPADRGAPWQRGQTDRAGWLAFVPDAPGRWRVKVIEPTGHGLDTIVEVSGDAAAGARTGGGVGTAGFVLRPLVGLAAIALVFGALFARRRLKARP